jgi:hypothetical protein
VWKVTNNEAAASAGDGRIFFKMHVTRSQSHPGRAFTHNSRPRALIPPARVSIV